MLKTLYFNGRALEYELERKRVKNINLRVRADGSVYVSASRRVPLEQVEVFLRSKAEFIFDAQQRFAAAQTPPPVLAEGARLCVLGREHTLHLVQGAKNTSQLGRDGILLTVKDAGDAALAERTLDKLLRALCEETVLGFCGEVYPFFAARGVAQPEIKFRRMKSRWGSCNSSRGILTFNTALVYAPRECVEYVVYHEFTHFLHPDHSPAFYDCLAEFIPDWKRRRKLLHEYVLYTGR